MFLTIPILFSGNATQSAAITNVTTGISRNYMTAWVVVLLVVGAIIVTGILIRFILKKVTKVAENDGNWGKGEGHWSESSMGIHAHIGTPYIGSDREQEANSWANDGFGSYEGNLKLFDEGNLTPYKDKNSFMK